MTPLRVTIATVLLAGSSLAWGRMPPGVELGSRQMAEAELYKPRIDFPEEARRRHIYGSGDFGLFVSTSSGAVQKVQPFRSTGSSILDSAAIHGFRRWRYKPEVLRAIQKRYFPKKRPEMVVIVIPITFRP